MSNDLNAKFIYKNQEYQIILQPKDCQNLPQPILLSLLTQHQYKIQSNVSSDVFQSFINYFTNRVIPSIQNENIDEYDQLSKELNLISISEIIQQKRNYNNDIKNDIKKLSDNFITDKSEIEHRISQRLDDLLISYGEELINSPIQSLCNIFSFQDCNFTNHDRLYELIQSQYQKTKNSEIFILLQFIDENSIKNESSHFCFKPIFDNASIIGKIQELKNQNEKFIENFIKKNKNISSNEISKNGLNYKLDEINRIAEVTSIESNLEEVFIPRSIMHQSIEYVIKEIGQFSCKYSPIKSLTFSEDSEIKCLDFNKINCEQLEKISIPESVEKIFINNDDYSQLSNILISDTNTHFKWFEESFLLGKSEENVDDFDVLIFARRNIEHAKIPSNIKRIGQYSFYNCHKLQTIEFPVDTKLVSIGSYAFYSSSIESIKIPFFVQMIGNFSFFSCGKLQKVEFFNNSELRSIGNYAFYNTSIKAIAIPKSVKTIGDKAFSSCSKIKCVEFCSDSKLQSLGNSAFYSIPIETITIPSRVKNLDEGWSIGLFNLTKINIPQKSRRFIWVEDSFLLGKSDVKIDDFDVLIFARKNIEKVKIPSNIKRIGSYCFWCCKNLQSVEFSANSKLSSIGDGAFYSTQIENIQFPSHVKMIGNQAFSSCRKLQKIDFLENSELNSIGERAFFDTPIEKVLIPKCVKTIGNFAFSSCKRLHNVEFTEDSMLSSIGNSTFEFPFIKTIKFPPHYPIHSQFEYIINQT